jgi:hypothetical protein
MFAVVLEEDEGEVSAMLILDTEMEYTNELPAASQLLRIWVARLWARLRRRPQPETQAGEYKNGQDRGTGLIL